MWPTLPHLERLSFANRQPHLSFPGTCAPGRNFLSGAGFPGRMPAPESWPKPWWRPIISAQVVAHFLWYCGPEEARTSGPTSLPTPANCCKRSRLSASGSASPAASGKRWKPPWEWGKAVVRKIFYIGPSMNPLLQRGTPSWWSLTVSASAGDVIVFQDPRQGQIVHRVVAVKAEGLVTKGDNNPTVDDRPCRAPGYSGAGDGHRAPGPHPAGAPASAGHPVSSQGPPMV
jgi:hypothetical protein